MAGAGRCVSGSSPCTGCKWPSEGSSDGAASFLLHGRACHPVHADAGVLGSTGIGLRQTEEPAPPAAAPNEPSQAGMEAPAAAAASALPAFNEAERDMGRRLHAQARHSLLLLQACIISFVICSPALAPALVGRCGGEDWR